MWRRGSGRKLFFFVFTVNFFNLRFDICRLDVVIEASLCKNIAKYLFVLIILLLDCDCDFCNLFFSFNILRVILQNILEIVLNKE